MHVQFGGHGRKRGQDEDGQKMRLSDCRSSRTGASTSPPAAMTSEEGKHSQAMTSSVSVKSQVISKIQVLYFIIILHNLF